ncbi:hypothetical protein F5984_20130 [Rudanella paleaurantiibacter]|uniref:TonB C-terminal domain-containing protein n=1 Tax=Rudanella paleaurantiibacter TaxID=2614655 RepID=A0A7J5TV85_9BACT|nr:hypothetical protein [Rudanella paleaurantiibacter]KAB7728062.1 hypothetical protein F5984_20130 [Rudanella paleaurantiibacter]
MIRLLFAVLFCALCGSSAFSQTVSDTTVTPIEINPEFPGGHKEFFNYVNSSLKLPESVVKTLYQGVVVVFFTVDTDGTVVVNDVNQNKMAFTKKRIDDEDRVTTQQELAAAVTKAFTSMPRWKPGTQNGKAVRVKYSMPFTIQFG